MHEVLVYRLEGLSLPRKSVVRLTDRPDMTLDVYLGCKTTIQHQLAIVLIVEKDYDRKSSIHPSRHPDLSPPFYTINDLALFYQIIMITRGPNGPEPLT